MESVEAAGTSRGLLPFHLHRLLSGKTHSGVLGLSRVRFTCSPARGGSGERNDPGQTQTGRVYQASLQPACQTSSREPRDAFDLKQTQSLKQPVIKSANIFLSRFPH